MDAIQSKLLVGGRFSWPAVSLRVVDGAITGTDLEEVALYVIESECILVESDHLTISGCRDSGSTLLFIAACNVYTLAVGAGAIYSCHLNCAIVTDFITSLGV